MKEEIPHERLRQAILECIGVQPPNTTKHILRVRLKLRCDASKVHDQDRDAFRDELYQLIRNTDGAYESNPPWHGPQGYRCEDLTRTLKKYLAKVHFEWGSSPAPGDWITVDERSGVFGAGQPL